MFTLPPTNHWKNGFLFPKIYREAESVVLTCCLKTHQFGGHFTLSLKCAVGMVPPGLGPPGAGGYPYMNELHSSPCQRQLIAEINTAYSPDLIVLDGVEFTAPIFEQAIVAKTKVDEDKMGPALQRVVVSDPSFRFHRDPLAGGMRAVRPVTEQLYRSGDTREEAFAVPPSGQFKPNAQGERVHAISQGKVGPVTGKMVSNIKPGNATMIATPGWVGEYL